MTYLFDFRPQKPVPNETFSEKRMNALLYRAICKTKSFAPASQLTANTYQRRQPYQQERSTRFFCAAHAAKLPAQRHDSLLKTPPSPSRRRSSGSLLDCDELDRMSAAATFDLHSRIVFPMALDFGARVGRLPASRQSQV